MKLKREILDGKLAKCNKGAHKIRENRFGISWCTVCGLLSNKSTKEQLKEEEKEIYTNYENNLHRKNS